MNYLSRNRGRSLSTTPTYRSSKKYIYDSFLGHCSLGNLCKYRHRPPKTQYKEKAKKVYVEKPKTKYVEKSLQLESVRPLPQPQDYFSEAKKSSMEFRKAIRKQEIDTYMNGLRQELISDHPRLIHIKNYLWRKMDLPAIGVMEATKLSKQLVSNISIQLHSELNQAEILQNIENLNLGTITNPFETATHLLIQLIQPYIQDTDPTAVIPHAYLQA